MTTNPVCIRLEQESILQCLKTEAMTAVQTVEAELELDLAAILKIDTAGVRALEGLARTADQRGIRIRLVNANVNVYKALLLLSLVRRFTFAN